jgi:hypothetical protein
LGIWGHLFSNGVDCQKVGGRFQQKVFEILWWLEIGVDARCGRRAPLARLG